MKKIFIPFILLGVFIACFWNQFGLKSGHREWMEEQANDDLSWYSKEDLNPERLETSFNTFSGDAKLIHFQIKDNQVYWAANWTGEGTDRLRKVCIMLSLASKYKRLPDADFLLTIHDGIISASTRSDAHEHMPVFCFAKREGIHAVLFPDPLTEGFAKRGRKRIQRAKLAPKHYWKNKKEIAFWRGGTTGGNFLMDNWYNMPRTKLSLLTLYHPEIIDAGYSVYNPMPVDVKEEMLNSLPILAWTSHKGHLQYKYLVIADGNTCTYPRYYLGLCSGSAVFKDDTQDYQWYYRALEPYKHYVPVAADFSDLPEKVLWAKNHDKEVKKIAVRGQRFVQHNLLPKHIYHYIVGLLEKYAELQDSEVCIADNMNLYTGSNKKKWKGND